jgi:hypothetical protein
VNYPELSKPLFHGSAEAVVAVDLSKSAPFKDFGRGFYTTNDRRQAEKFARLKAKRLRVDNCYVSIFKLQNTDSLNINKFVASDGEWFDFVLGNRGYNHLALADGIMSDIVIGPVANDAVGAVLNLFVSGAYGDPQTAEAKNMAIRLLLTQKLNNQIFFGTERAISQLAFLEVYDVRID